MYKTKSLSHINSVNNAKTKPKTPSPFATSSSSSSSPYTPTLPFVRQTPSSIYRTIANKAALNYPTPSKKLRFADQLHLIDEKRYASRSEVRVLKPVISRTLRRQPPDVVCKTTPKTVALSPATSPNIKCAKNSSRKTVRNEKSNYELSEKVKHGTGDDSGDTYKSSSSAATNATIMKRAEAMIDIETPNGTHKRCSVSLPSSGDRMQQTITCTHPMNLLSPTESQNSISVNVNVAVDLDCVANNVANKLNDDFNRPLSVLIPKEDKMIGKTFYKPSNVCLENSITSAIKVAVRLRPFLPQESETNKNNRSIVEMNSNTVSIANTDNENYNKLEFDFDYCLNSLDRDLFDYADQDIVYRRLGEPLLDHALEGYNVCLFAYGQTGSGKSYTMMGTQQVPGIIPRFAVDMFRKITASYDRSIYVKVSYFEIYNEKIRDLFADRAVRPLRVREHPQTGPYIEDLTMHLVDTYDELMDILSIGIKKRATAMTALNDESSRSHAIFTIILTQCDMSVLSSPSEMSINGQCISKVNLVDLAGSERVGISGTSGDRLKEGSLINKSLLTLGKVISQLAEQGNSKSSSVHVPYRESTLTWILKESLGGNSRTSMIATISPLKCHLEETLSTLRYAAIARRIVNIVSINEDPKSKKIRELMQEIALLREQQQRMADLANVNNVNAIDNNNKGSRDDLNNVGVDEVDDEVNEWNNCDVNGNSIDCSVRNDDIMRTNSLEDEQNSLLEQIKKARQTISKFPELVIPKSSDNELLKQIYSLFKDVLNKNSFLEDTSATVANDSWLDNTIQTEVPTDDCWDDNTVQTDAPTDDCWDEEENSGEQSTIVSNNKQNSD